VTNRQAANGGTMGDVHVVPKAAEWAVESNGQERESFDTQTAAINWACHLVRAEGGELVIHGMNGHARSTAEAAARPSSAGINRVVPGRPA